MGSGVSTTGAYSSWEEVEERHGKQLNVIADQAVYQSLVSKNKRLCKILAAHVVCCFAGLAAE